jgi:hypothetical protein
MLYTSPFELLNLPSAELQQMDRRMLQLKKKQLMAELQLQGSGLITIGNKELTKNDIVQLFEQLEQDDALAFHAAIAADPALLQFLQTGKIKPGQKFNYNPLYQEAGFIDFVSPFYKEVFNRHILKALAANGFDRIEGVFGNPVLLNGADYDDCFGRLHGYLEEKQHGLQQLKHQFDANRRMDITALHQYYIFDWINTLNKLPDDFANFRDDYAIDLYNFAVDLWNGKRRDEARALLYGISELYCAPATKRLIADLLERANRVAAPAGTSSGGSSGGSWVWAVISLFIIIVRIGVTCNNDRSNKNYDFSSLIESQRRYGNGYQVRSGFSAFKPVTKRDRALLDFLNALRLSGTDAQAATVSLPLLEPGSNPYLALFAKPIFKNQSALKQDAKGQYVLPVPDKEPATKTERLIEAIEDRPTKSPDEAVPDRAISREPQLMDESELLSGTSAIDINNNIDQETIVIFCSNRQIFGVYVKPRSRYTVQVPSGHYHAFCYSGKGFGKNLALKLPATAYPGAKKDFVNSGRFARPSSDMLPYLLPKNNLHFTAGNPNTSIEGNALITIDLTEREAFDMLSGKGVTAHRTMIMERGE